MVHLQACHAGDICTVLIICESNPLVISIPIQHGNNNAYSTLRFLFWYHGTRSCCTILVSTGSACCALDAFPIGDMLAVSAHASLLHFRFGVVSAFDVSRHHRPRARLARLDTGAMDQDWRKTVHTRVGHEGVLNKSPITGGLAQSMRPSGVRRIYAGEGTLDHHSVICDGRR